MSEAPYNPLDKSNLAKSIEAELLAREVRELGATDDIMGAGVYAIYYCGGFRPYRKIAEMNRNDAFSKPIYVGKAIPEGGRKGGLSKDSAKGHALADRLRQHAASIREVTNLKLDDFFARYLVVDDIWIPLGENILIETFKPLWNRAIDGFGNKDPGKRRATQFKSPWDVLHPGRKFSAKLADGGLTRMFLEKRVDDYLLGRKPAPLPKIIAAQQQEENETEEST
jgi:Eco29kI restriction endonuclease